MEAASEIAQVLGRIPSGLFILTVRHEEEETGMLCSWVMQAGFDPPAVTVAVRQGRFVADWLLAGAPFLLNVLPEKSKTLLRHFARGFERGDPAFEGLEIERSASGIPVLPGCVGYLECQANGKIDSGDHHIFAATITAGALASDSHPLVHIRNHGMRY